MSKGGSEVSTQINTPSGKVWNEQVANYDAAKAIADRPYAAYSGPQLAGLNNNQSTAGALIQQPHGWAQMAAASNAAQGAANYQAPMVTAPGYQAAMQGVMNTAAANAGPATSWGVTNTAAANAGQATSWGVTNTHGEQAGPAAQMQASQAQAAQAQYAAAQAAAMQAAQAGQANTMNAASAGPAAQAQSYTQGNAAQMQAAQMAGIKDVTAGKFTDANLGSYMNPYTSSVIDQSLNTLGRQRDVLQNQNNAKAAASGAFGGSRQAIMNAETNRAYLDTAANTTANLNNQNFSQAQSAIQADQQRALAAAQGNQQTAYNTGALNTNNQQSAAAANQQAINAQRQFDANQQQSASTWNAGATNQQNQYNASNSQAANLANMNSLNQRQEFNTGLQQQANQISSGYQQATNLANAAQQNQTNQYNAGLQTDVSKYNANNSQAASLANMNATNSRAEYDTTNRMNAGAATAAAHNSAAAQQAANANQMNQFNAQLEQGALTNTANSYNSAAAQQASNANSMNLANAQLQQTALSQTAQAHNTALTNQANAYNTAASTNAEMNLRSQLANQSASQNAVNTNLSAANSLNGMGLDQQKWNLTNANANLQFGNMLQAQQQKEYDLAQQQWAAQQNYPAEQLAIKQQALAGMPISTTKSSTSPTYNNYGANALSGALGAYKLADQMGYAGSAGGWGGTIAAGAGGLLSLI